MLINTDRLTSQAYYFSLNSDKTALGVYYHGREYNYCVCYLVMWLWLKGVSSVDAMTMNMGGQVGFFFLFFYHKIAWIAVNTCTITISISGSIENTLSMRWSSEHRQTWPIPKDIKWSYTTTVWCVMKNRKWHHCGAWSPLLDNWSSWNREWVFHALRMCVSVCVPNAKAGQTLSTSPLFSFTYIP